MLSIEFLIHYGLRYCCAVNIYHSSLITHHYFSHSWTFKLLTRKKDTMEIVVKRTKSEIPSYFCRI